MIVFSFWSFYSAARPPEADELLREFSWSPACADKEETRMTTSQAFTGNKILLVCNNITARG